MNHTQNKKNNKEKAVGPDLLISQYPLSGFKPRELNTWLFKNINTWEEFIENECEEELGDHLRSILYGNNFNGLTHLERQINFLAHISSNLPDTRKLAEESFIEIKQTLESSGKIEDLAVECKSQLFFLSVILEEYELFERLFLDVQIDINWQGSKGLTPLHVAVENRNEAMVEKLLNAPKIAPNKATQHGKTAFYLAVTQTPRIIALFLQNPHVDANQANVNGDTPFYRAVCKLDLGSGIINLLLNDPRIDVNQTTNEGRSPLYRAIRKKDPLMVKLFLSHPKIKLPPSSSKTSFCSELLFEYNAHFEGILLGMLHPKIEIENKLLEEFKKKISIKKIVQKLPDMSKKLFEEMVFFVDENYNPSLFNHRNFSEVLIYEPSLLFMLTNRVFSYFFSREGVTKKNLLYLCRLQRYDLLVDWFKRLSHSLEEEIYGEFLKGLFSLLPLAELFCLFEHMQCIYGEDKKLFWYNSLREELQKTVQNPMIEPNLPTISFPSRTPLEIAITSNESHLVSVLLHHPLIEPNYAIDTSYSPLALAIHSENESIITSLLSHPKIRVNTLIASCPEERRLLANPHETRTTPLIFSLSRNLDLARDALLAHPKIDLNYSVNKLTALNYAIEFRKLDQVTALLNHPKIIFRGENHEYPLHFAIKQIFEHGEDPTRLKIFNLILNSPHCDVNYACNGVTPLLQLIRGSRPDLVMKMYKEMILHPEFVLENTVSIFFEAVERNYFLLVEKFLWHTRLNIREIFLSLKRRDLINKILEKKQFHLVELLLNQVPLVYLNYYRTKFLTHEDSDFFLRRMSYLLGEGDQGRRTQYARETKLDVAWAAELFGLTVSLCDGHLALKNSSYFDEENNRTIRFFKMQLRLPMELQMLVANRAQNIDKLFILSNDLEYRLKLIFLHYARLEAV